MIWKDYKEVFLNKDFNPEFENFNEKNFKLFYSLNNRAN